MFKSLLILVLSAFSSFVAANCGDVICSNVNITRLFMPASGDVSVRTSGIEADLACDAGSGNYLTLRKGHENYETIFALFLTAHTTGKVVTIRTSSSGACEIAYALSDA